MVVSSIGWVTFLIRKALRQPLLLSLIPRYGTFAGIFKGMSSFEGLHLLPFHILCGSPPEAKEDVCQGCVRLQ